MAPDDGSACNGWAMRSITRGFRRLMQFMGLQAVYPKPKTTVPDKENKIYPYLLRDLAICRPNHVWASDITYIRMHQGFMYLVAVNGLVFPLCIAWELSNTLDGLVLPPGPRPGSPRGAARDL